MSVSSHEAPKSMLSPCTAAAPPSQPPRGSPPAAAGPQEQPCTRVQPPWPRPLHGPSAAAPRGAQHGPSCPQPPRLHRCPQSLPHRHSAIPSFPGGLCWPWGAGPALGLGGSPQGGGQCRRPCWSPPGLNVFALREENPWPGRLPGSGPSVAPGRRPPPLLTAVPGDLFCLPAPYI